MMKVFKYCHLLLAMLTSISFAKTANARETATLSIVVDGIRHQKGEICFRIYAGEQGFPLNNTSEVQSGCAKITGSSIKKEFLGLQPGAYAVAVVDDQNGDRQLNRDLFGIPQEGFGLSQNPVISIRTGIPKFKDASFVLKQDTKISIVMKYSLDP
ncbi:MAG: DUF2141 domain-containing protein [Desmonostoc vinosum HA7617-LM4]|jgi:uncharacterized protein (DUF2141 family)|nr:DUF2141 domain-containing protein [Desmonostoc vinosum HA7617-LM4]